MKTYVIRYRPVDLPMVRVVEEPGLSLVCGLVGVVVGIVLTLLVLAL